MASRLVYRIVWIPSLVALAGMVTVFAQEPYKTPEAAAFKPYQTEDKFIAVGCPGNWRPRQRSANANLTKVGFEPAADVKFEVTADLTGSLLGDLDRAGDAQMQGLAESAATMPGNSPLNVLGGGGAAEGARKSPLEKAHDREGAAMEADKEEYPDFIDGKPKKTDAGGQEAYLSDFTFSRPGLMRRREMMGRRATMMTTERQVSVVYYCPKDAANKLMPVFNKMFKSLRAGQSAGN